MSFVLLLGALIMASSMVVAFFYDISAYWDIGSLPPNTYIYRV
jgi:hypothetical protein